MQRGRDAARVLRVAAETAHFALQLGRELRALLRVGVEKRLNLRVFHAVGGRAESVFAVFQRFDQVVQRRNYLIVVSHCLLLIVQILPRVKLLSPQVFTAPGRRFRARW